MTVNSFDLLMLLAVAVPCGLIGRLTSVYARKGWILYFAVAFLGALIGVWIARSFNVPSIYIFKRGSHSFPIIWALIGSVFMVAGLGLFIRPSMR